MYSTIQYSTIVIIVNDKCHRTIPQYTVSYSVIDKNISTTGNSAVCHGPANIQVTSAVECDLWYGVRRPYVALVCRCYTDLERAKSFESQRLQISGPPRASEVLEIIWKDASLQFTKFWKFGNLENFVNRKEAFFQTIKKFRKLLRALIFGAGIFSFFRDFLIFVAPANKGDIGASYAVPQAALNSRGNLDIGWDMADRRKHGAPSGLVPSSRPRQRSRLSSDREGIVQRMEAAAVIVLVLSTIVTSVVAHRLLPKPRQTIHEPRRLDWEEHTTDVNRRRLFRRMYRMDEHTFKKLTEMLRPTLERNEYYASEKRERDRGSRSHGEFRVCFL